MHPALSVIFFTVLTGAGLGQLFLFAVMIAGGHTPGSTTFGLTSTLLALALVGIGVLSSSTHLGRPERAWRSFSQWRSSWLSREAVLMALVVPVGVALAAGWLADDRQALWWRLAAVLTLLLAPATVYATAMIYASLKPVRQWRNHWTKALYLVLALMSGSTLAYACLRGFGYGAWPGGVMALVLMGIGLAVKLGYWWHIDRGTPVATAESATGLGFIGKVRPLDPPHTEENYLLKEMGYRVARRHRARLRRITLLAGFALPAALVAMALNLTGWYAGLAACTAAAVMLFGLVVERWLFFAEATHTVTLYYGGTA